MPHLKIFFAAVVMALGMSLETYATAHHRNAPAVADSVTAVSDTTDNDEDLADSATTTTLSAPDDADDGSQSLWEWSDVRHPARFVERLFDWAAFGVSGLAFIFILLLLFSPLILLIIAIWLIVRHGRRTPARPQTSFAAQNATPDHTESTSDATESERFNAARTATPRRTTSEKKDRATLHIALGIGLIIFFIIIYSRICIAIGALLLCYGAGEYINARREERRNDEQSL